MNPKMVIIVITAALASLLEIIDSSIVNVAIPTMMGNLGVTLDEISWVSTGYMIANSIVLPIAAWFGTRLGRKNYFTGAILAFTAASFLCGIAPNLPTLIIFRIFQGLAGGALLPTSQTLIQEQFPREKAGMATAVFGMSVMIGPALGPTLGGYLTDNFGWRSIFNINIPLGLLAATMSYLHVDNVKNHQSEIAAEKAETAGAVGPDFTAPLVKPKMPGVDWLGLLFLSVGVGCFQFIMERGEVEGWWDSRLIQVLSIFAATGVASFIWWELRIPHPIMNLRLFKKNAVSSGTLLMLTLGVMIYSLTFVVPIFVSRVIDLTAMQTGMLFLPGSIITIFIMYGVGQSMRFMNPKHLVIIGMCLAEAALFSMSRFTSATSGDALYLPLILRGVASGFLFIPINGMVLSQFRGEELGQVSGMMNFFRQIGGSVGIASLSTMLTRFSVQNYNSVMTKVSAFSPAALQAYWGAQALPLTKFSSQIGLGTPDQIALKALNRRVQNQVFILSFQDLCWVIMVLFAFAFIPLYLIKAKKVQKPVADSH